MSINIGDRTVDTMDVMSKYELYSLTISIIAIAISILVPFSKWIYSKFFLTAKVEYYSTGEAVLFFNQSGSYIRLYGVLESKRKAATIKKMRIILTRQRDDRKLNLTWSYLVSPINQSMLGNYVQTTEAAHPFRVEADSVACAFVEYSDPSDSSGIKIRRICNELAPLIQQILRKPAYNEALTVLMEAREYIEAKHSLQTEFFWEIGKYAADVIVDYDKKKQKSFSLGFEVSEQCFASLQRNIEESLITEVKRYYGIPFAFQSNRVEVTERRQ